MSPETACDPAPRKTAAERLGELRRALQRQVRRKLNAYEQAALERCALLLLRAEMAAFDPKADSNSVVRLDNASRRARLDFERLCSIQPRKPHQQRSMADIEAELRAHA